MFGFFSLSSYEIQFDKKETKEIRKTKNGVVTAFAKG